MEQPDQSEQSEPPTDSDPRADDLDPWVPFRPRRTLRQPLPRPEPEPETGPETGP